MDGFAYGFAGVGDRRLWRWFHWKGKR
ncbi:hypothetical protein A2U01_0040296, partial [Trifolium medium]|nr:hypothetical protein [Trifolium medium]